MATDDSAEDLEEATGSCDWLLPRRRFKLRLGICIALCALGLIGTSAAGPKFAFCLSMGLLTGTFSPGDVSTAATCHGPTHVDTALTL